MSAAATAAEATWRFYEILGGALLACVALGFAASVAMALARYGWRRGRAWAARRLP